METIKQDYEVVILIDGLVKKEREIISRLLRTSRIPYDKVRRGKTSDILIRLADSLAGFLRDWIEEQNYTEIIYKSFSKGGFIVE